MKVLILAGGRGTRLAEETSSRPKPMVEIGGRPILWHLMNFYASYGFKEFLVACGYKGEMIKEYFKNIAVHESDFFVDLRDGSLDVIHGSRLDWRVGLVDTGMDTMTGGRLRRLRGLIGDETCMATYGDGLSDVNLSALLQFHRTHGKLATVTAVRPPARFGGLRIVGEQVEEFTEKPQAEGGWINGGYFVFEPGVFDYLQGDDTILEREPLERLAREGQLMAFRHPGFFQPMDTVRERDLLDNLWSAGTAPWHRWNQPASSAGQAGHP
ncbi:MAG: glucose-1-phosphate cytidylyltransferase [Cytophagaceae bacterium]|nr:glucose-1-phosphate cytidylyltransferase [Gemmatimonadaceae bacterium]